MLNFPLSPTSGPASKYSEVLAAQLQQLYMSLLTQYQTDTEHLRNSILLLQGEMQGQVQPRGSERYEFGLGEIKGDSLELQSDAEDLDHVMENPCPQVVSKWAGLAEKLLDAQEQNEDEPEDVDKLNDVEPLLFPKDGLQMRSAWSLGLQEASRLHRNRNYRISVAASTSTLRMNDALKDSSCLQRFVVGPRSSIQLIWSFVGSLFILWDLITIPLEMFDIPTFIEFLTEFGNVTFAFWICDMPSHVIFGREIDGKVELRPVALFKQYVRTWFLLDLTVISIDVMLLVLSEVHEGLKSARFLRTLRLLRLLRLLRVAKLQQALTLLANRFLSAHAFMVMKVVAGLMMILAINHLIACCWYGIGSLQVDGKSWIQRSDIEEAGFAESYAASIHWALTQFTPATNNIAPDNAVERCLVAMGFCWILSGKADCS